VVVLREESSVSRSGKHAVRELVVDVSEGVVKTPRVRRKRSVKPTYSKGEAYEVEVDDSGIIVHLRMVKCLGKRYRGTITVLDRGVVVLRMKYINGLLRKSCGNREYLKYVRLVLDHLRIPYRRINVDTGLEACQ